MSFLSPTIRDHRRRATTLERPDRLAHPAPGQTSLNPRQRDEIISRLKMDQPGPRFWIAAAIGMTLWLTLVVLSILMIRWVGLPAWLTWLAVAVAPVGVPLVFARAGYWYMSRIRHRQMIQALIDTGLCATCAYRIDNLVAGPDGCVVCPECGAAWRTGSSP